MAQQEPTKKERICLESKVLLESVLLLLFVHWACRRVLGMWDFSYDLAL